MDEGVDLSLGNKRGVELSLGKNKKEVKMKTRYRLAVWAVMAVVGSTIVGGGFWVWLIGIVIGKFVARLALTAVVAIAVYLLVYTLIFGGMYWLLTI